MQKEWKERILRNGSCIFDHDIKKESTQQNLGRQGKELDGEFKKLRKAEGKQFYFSMIETAFVERRVRSLRKSLYHYMEEYAYKYIHKLSHFVAILNSRKNCSTDLIL